MKWPRSTLSSVVQAHFYHPFEMPDDHRFHTAAVIAFKAVYTLEKTRHENDTRVLALYVEYVVLNVDYPSPSH